MGKGRQRTTIRQLIEMHPVCFCLTWVCGGFVGLLTTLFCLGHVSWKIFVYCLGLFLIVLIYILSVILYLIKFGKELQHHLGLELEEAICCQNRHERPNDGTFVCGVLVKSLSKNAIVITDETIEAERIITKVTEPTPTNTLSIPDE